MPNWCNNSIKIYGPKDKVKKLVEGAEEGQFLDTVMPMPLELTDTVAGPDAETKAEQDARDKLKAEHGAENWYDWRVNNWATKWEVCEFYGVVHGDCSVFIGDFICGVLCEGAVGVVNRDV